MTPDCSRCRDSAPLAMDITMAFQPIFNVSTGQPHTYEALVRGGNGEGAGEVLSRVTDETRYSFDQLCRTTAIRTASGLGLKEADAAPRLSINFLPNAVYEPRACIRQTLGVAMETGFPLNRIMFEKWQLLWVENQFLINTILTCQNIMLTVLIRL